MLDDAILAQLRDVLARLTRPIAITAVVDDGAASQEMRALLREVASTSPLVEVTERHGHDERTPSFGIHLPGEEPRVVFAGLPLGHELTSLILALLHVGGHPPKASAEALEQIGALDGDLRFETYFSQSCQNCPDVVQALNLMAARNPRVRHVAIDGALHRAEVEARQVMAAGWSSTRSSRSSTTGPRRGGAPRRWATASPSTCWSWAADPPAPRRRSTPRGRALTPASSPSGSAARSWTRSRSRT
jgi:alkyl hydroperoxide reductase subunit AhpF